MMTWVVAWRRTNDLNLLGYLSQRRIGEKKKRKELKEIAHKQPAESPLRLAFLGPSSSPTPRLLANGRAPKSLPVFRFPAIPGFPRSTGNMTETFQSNYCYITVLSRYFSVFTSELRLFPKLPRSGRELAFNTNL